MLYMAATQVLFFQIHQTVRMVNHPSVHAEELFVPLKFVKVV